MWENLFFWTFLEIMELTSTVVVSAKFNSK